MKRILQCDILGFLFIVALCVAYFIAALIDDLIAAVYRAAHFFKCR